jgi:hypothetical protein
MAYGKVAWPERTNRLQSDTCKSASPQQSLWASVFEMDDLIADRDFSRTAINQIDDLRRYL